MDCYVESLLSLLLPVSLFVCQGEVADEEEKKEWRMESLLLDSHEHKRARKGARADVHVHS